MVEPAKDWRGAHRACCKTGRRGRIGDALLQSLMWPIGIKICDVLPEDEEQVGFTQDEQVVEALATHTAKQPFTAGIGKQYQMHSMHPMRREYSGLPTRITH
jgi:hypothetical protein